MKPIITIAISFIFATFSLQASAHDGCLNNSSSLPVCAPPHGGIARDIRGEIVCGKGQCIRNHLNETVCSGTTGGYATLNRAGRAVCTDGCKPASAKRCQTPEE